MTTYNKEDRTLWSSSIINLILNQQEIQSRYDKFINEVNKYIVDMDSRLEKLIN